MLVTGQFKGHACVTAHFLLPTRWYTDFWVQFLENVYLLGTFSVEKVNCYVSIYENVKRMSILVL